MKKATVTYKSLSNGLPVAFDVYVGDKTLESYTEGSKLPVLLFFHGGGFVSGNKDTLLPTWLLGQLSVY